MLTPPGSNPHRIVRGLHYWTAFKSMVVHGWRPSHMQAVRCGTLRHNATGPFETSHGCILLAGHGAAGSYDIAGIPHHVDATGRAFTICH